MHRTKNLVTQTFFILIAASLSSLLLGAKRLSIVRSATDWLISANNRDIKLLWRENSSRKHSGKHLELIK